MIKFFRKIRQNLLMENKTGKYFKYAIGEIILVMVGIILALQINNWNNQKVDRKLEKRYLSELILDLQTDSIVISKIKKTSDEQLRTKNKLQSYFDGQSFSEDSLRFFFGRQWHQTDNFNPITTTLDEMKSTGNIGVIQNTAIRRQILEAYNYYTTHINNNENRYRIQQDALVEVNFSKTPNLLNSTYKTFETLDINAALSDFEIQNRLLGNYAKGFNQALDSLKTVNTKLISDIRTELKRIEK